MWPRSIPRLSVKVSGLQGYALGELHRVGAELACDQEGSRLLQRKIEAATEQDCERFTNEILPHAVTLIQNVCGSGVIMKLLDHAPAASRQALSLCVRGRAFELACSQCGPRVLPRCLECLEPSARAEIAQELTARLPDLVRDANGSHVLQRCVERTADLANWLVRGFQGWICDLGTTASGCRCIQRVLERCGTNEAALPLLEEVLHNVSTLVGDQFGNYLVQHVVGTGDPRYQSCILEKLRGSFAQLSTHKFASNVVEKLFEFASPQTRTTILNELTSFIHEEGVTGLVKAAQDQYGNYVMQKIFDFCDEQQKRAVREHLAPHIARLRRAHFAKHFIWRLEQGQAAEQQRAAAQNVQTAAPPQQYQRTGSQTHVSAPRRTSGQQHMPPSQGPMQQVKPVELQRQSSQQWRVQRQPATLMYMQS